MDKIRYGMIGGSRIALRHLQSLSQLQDQFELKAIASRSIENAQRIKQSIEPFGYDLSTIRAYDDYLDMLKNEDLDLVAITTESGRHSPIALDCLNHGVHVFVEKPMAITLEDCDLMIERAKEKNLQLFVTYQARFTPSVIEVKKAIEQGSFGKLLHATVNIRLNRNKEYYQQAEWRGTKAQDGGTLLNQCIHSIDILRWLLDSEPVEVFTYTDNLIHPEIEIEDIGLALVNFKNGSYGVIEGTVNTYPKNLEETLALFGEKGTVKLCGKNLDTIEHWNVEGTQIPTIEKYADTALACYGKIYSNIAGCLLRNETPLVTGIEAKKTMDLINAIYRSAESGRPVRL